MIRPVAESFALTVLRADEIHSPGAIIEQIRVAIQQSRLCIADLSFKNPNVLYEVGIAHTLKKPTILLSSDLASVPFDVAANRILLYDINNMEIARRELKHAIQHVLVGEQLAEAENLIGLGSYRAAAAVLGVLLEQSMRRLAESVATVASQTAFQRLSLSQFLRILEVKSLITNSESTRIKEAITTRNRAIHHLSEPTEHEVKTMLEVVSEFLAKFSPNHLQH